MQIITMNNKTYQRDVELIGDVEKITWFEVIKELSDDFVGYTFSSKEIYDQETLETLEMTYLDALTLTMTPVWPII